MVCINKIDWTLIYNRFCGWFRALHEYYGLCIDVVKYYVSPADLSMDYNGI